MIAEQFLRTSLLLKEDGIKRLMSAKVMLVGLGAVGGYVLEAFARAGVGHLILVDFDKFDESNINRQILALHSTVGRKKTEVAKERVLAINPACEVEIIDTFVDEKTLPFLLEKKVDYVIDAIDSLNSKCGLIEALIKNNIPFISSMGAALKTDPTHIKYATLDKTQNCGLAKFIRKRLKKRGTDIKKVECVFSDEQTNSEEKGFIENKEEGVRNTLGSLPTITAIFGLMIANKVILEISKKKA